MYELEYSIIVFVNIFINAGKHFVNSEKIFQFIYLTLYVHSCSVANIFIRTNFLVEKFNSLRSNTLHFNTSRRTVVGYDIIKLVIKTLLHLTRWTFYDSLTSIVVKIKISAKHAVTFSCYDPMKRFNSRSSFSDITLLVLLRQKFNTFLAQTGCTSNITISNWLLIQFFGFLFISR